MVGSIVLLVVLIALNGVFAAAELAVVSMNDKKLKRMVEEGDRRAIKLAALTEQPAKFLSTIQIAITLSGLMSSAFAADNFAGPIVDALIKAGMTISADSLKNIVVIVITLILAYFNLVFGELVPKRIAMKKSEGIALSIAGMLYSISRICAPIVALLTASTNGILRLIGLHGADDGEKLTEEAILMMLEEGNEQGILDEQETEIIQNVFEMGDISCEQICTHRMDVDALDEEDLFEGRKELMLKNKHTYYPVYKDSKDHISGILDSRDYLRLADKTKENVLKYAIKPAYFVPEEIKAATLLRDMRQKKKYFAVLIDEYGGMTGIITAHDLIEVLVGSLPDEEAEEEVQIYKIRENLWRISKDAELDEISEALNINFPDTQCGTFNGLMYNLLGRIPEDGEQINCTYGNLNIYINKVEKHRIVEAQIEIMKEQ